jgi:hypothetical protein
METSAVKAANHLELNGTAKAVPLESVDTNAHGGASCAVGCEAENMSRIMASGDLSAGACCKNAVRAVETPASKLAGDPEED